MKQYHTQGGYCYRQYSNGTTSRIPKHEYLQTGGGQLKSPETGNLLTGAGIAILVPYQKRWAVALFHEKHSNSYQDLGGSIDPEDTDLKEVAIREAKEESANLIHIHPKCLFTYFIEKLPYRCYLIAVPPNTINPTTFKTNHFLLEKNNAPHHYQEMDDLDFFYLTDLLNQPNAQSQLIPNVHGIPKKIHPRPLACLRLAHQENKIHSVITNPKHIHHTTSEQVNYHPNHFDHLTKSIQIL